MALSLAITANPDVLSLDGASQSQIRIVARDENGQPKANVLLRAEIVVGGSSVEYGSLSARTRSTDSNGVASFTYTAPEMVGSDAPNVQVYITPEGAGYEDAASHTRRVVTIRLVPPGVVGAVPSADFSFTPASPAAFSNVRFDASASTGGLGSTITSYAWDFGDNVTASGAVTTHQFTAAGTYQVTLIVTNSSGLSSQVVKPVTVGAGSAPVADFLINPSSANVGETVFFNGTTSVAGTGHSIVRYDWNFGDGDRRSGSSVSHVYSIAGTYNVMLTVTDEVGQTNQIVKPVTIGGSPVTASFTFSPTDPTVGTTVNFNASASKGEGSNSIKTYEWDFGCSAAAGDCSVSTRTTTSPTTTNVFNRAFTYTVRVTVTDSAGKKATTTKDVTIAP
jgi:PKD repeat protein